MANPYKAPGVYIEELSKLAPSIAPVETAIPAFIGYTAIATETVGDDLRLKPKRIASMDEYERFFGVPQKEEKIVVTITETQDPAGKTLASTAVATLAEADRSKHIMCYAMQMFFANGGGPCWIVSVGAYKAPIGAAITETELHAGLDAIAKVGEPTIIVFPEAQGLSISDFATLHDAALLQCNELKDRFVIMDVHGGNDAGGAAISLSDPDTDLLAAVNNFRSSGIGTNNLMYGAAYGPNIETAIDFHLDESKTVVNLVVNGAAAAPSMLNSLAASDNARYEAAKAAVGNLSCMLPPSTSIAGIYASVDRDRGVWKAPANVSVSLVSTPCVGCSNEQQDQMNVDSVGGKSVNVIREFTGKGTLVWGARTLAGNDNEWRYVSVRRLFIFVEESVKRATEQFVFEPNDANTWVRAQAMIENFLTTLWRQGALQGVKREHAFYVAVGLGKSMSALDILEGRMIIEIGMAAVRPAEFIVLKFSHTMAQP